METKTQKKHTAPHSRILQTENRNSVWCYTVKSLKKKTLCFYCYTVTTVVHTAIAAVLMRGLEKEPRFTAVSERFRVYIYVRFMFHMKLFFLFIDIQQKHPGSAYPLLIMVYGFVWAGGELTMGFMVTNVYESDNNRHVESIQQPKCQTHRIRKRAPQTNKTKQDAKQKTKVK